MNLVREIDGLKRMRAAIILAYNYTAPEIQNIADFAGDSLELSRKTMECHAPVIVFCGVRFLAEPAKRPDAQSDFSGTDDGTGGAFRATECWR